MRSFLIVVLTLSQACAYSSKSRWKALDNNRIIKACWSEPLGPNKEFSVPLICDEGQVGDPITWDHIPIHVSADTSSAVMANRAVKVWNEWIGFDVFVFDMELTKGTDVFVMFSPKSNGQKAGTTAYILKAANHRMFVAITIYALGKESPETFVHEFGHALGLEHKDEYRDIMAPSIEGMFMPKASLEDLAVLRHKYRHTRRRR